MSDFDFIPEFSKYLCECYPIKPLWGDLVAATTLASVLDMNTYFKNRYGKNKCNMWIAYIAPSGDFKSIPIDEKIIPLLRVVGREVKRRILLPSIASTVEGMIKYFKEEEKDRSGLVCRDELTTFFKESLNKPYLTDEMEIYSKMYDGWLYPRETMTFHSKDPMEVYVNLIGATTPKYLYDQLPIQFFFQGCGNRFNYVRHKVETRTNYSEEELFMPEEKWMSGELPEELERFVIFLKEVIEAPYQIFMSDPEVMRMSKNFRNEREELKLSIKERSPDAFKREYISRDWQKSLKLAQLKGISRMTLSKLMEEMEEKKQGRMIHIEVQDMEWGQKIVDACYKDFEEIVAEWKTYIPTEDKKVLKNTQLLYQYLEAVKEYGEISQLKLATIVGNATRNDEFYNVLGSLVSGGYIKQLTDTADYIRQKGITWMEEMMINPKFKNPPCLYKYVKPLP